jgi:REP element-mobilizing transposase RayT
MSYNELRKGRWSAPGQEYLVTTVTAGRKCLFSNLASALPVVQALEQSPLAGEARWLAWVLMPDHFHGLLCLNGNTSLSDVMRRFKGRSAHHWNRKMGGRGSVWESGFHDHALRREEDRRAVARYIVANPVRAGLVEHVGDYPFWDVIWLDPLSG